MNQLTAPRFDASALITIDTQNDFTLRGAPLLVPGTRDAVPNMVRLINAYRQGKRPVIHVVRLYLEDGSNAELCRREAIHSGNRMLTPGSNGAELVDELKPDGNCRLDADTLLAGGLQQIGRHEYIMYKPRWGAFYRTGLERFLSDQNIHTLIFTGCNYPNCPRASIYEASERDYRVVLVDDAVSGLDTRGVSEMENIGVRVMSTAEILSLASRYLTGTLLPQ